MQVGQSIQDTTVAHRKYHRIQVEKQGLRLVKKTKKVFYEFLSTRSWMPKHICASIPLLGGIVQYLVLRPIWWVHQGLLLSESLLQGQLLLRSHTCHGAHHAGGHIWGHAGSHKGLCRCQRRGWFVQRLSWWRGDLLWLVLSLRCSHRACQWWYWVLRGKLEVIVNLFKFLQMIFFKANKSL